MKSKLFFGSGADFAPQLTKSIFRRRRVCRESSLEVRTRLPARRGQLGIGKVGRGHIQLAASALRVWRQDVRPPPGAGLDLEDGHPWPQAPEGQGLHRVPVLVARLLRGARQSPSTTCSSTGPAAVCPRSRGVPRASPWTAATSRRRQVSANARRACMVGSPGWPAWRRCGRIVALKSKALDMRRPKSTEAPPLARRGPGQHES